MEKETKNFLAFVEKNLYSGVISNYNWKAYINNLPFIYQQDVSFRLLFDWHVDMSLNTGKASFVNSRQKKEVPIFKKQIELINLFSHSKDSDYQLRELIYYHARVNLMGKKLLEIGGITPSDVLFELIGVSEYINIESPDYIEADDGYHYSKQHKSHDRKQTILCNAEDLSSNVENGSQDLIFSVACFEHIYDLEVALESCYNVLKNKGYLYSFFAPIYSYLQDGDHGVIPQHNAFKQKPYGFHLLSHNEQREKLIEAGITNPKEIQDFLAMVNFNRIPNRLIYEDYERILSESSFWLAELIRLDWYNITKKYPKEIKEIRKSNPLIGNVMTNGFRTLLVKV